MSKTVQDLFTSIAPKYDFLNHFLSLSIDRRWREKAISLIKGHPNAQILDLCAGTLDLTQRILELFPHSQVTALDFSMAMLEHGRKKLPAHRGYSLICADGHDLPLAENQFDAVVCAFGIRNLEGRVLACREIRRVLKPEGKLVVLEFFRPKKIFPRLFFQTYGKYIIPRLGGMISKNRQAYEYLQNSIGDFLSIEDYKSLLKKNGFSSVSSQALSGGIAQLVLAE